MELTRNSLDGSRVTVTLPDRVDSNGAISHLVFRSGSRVAEFEGGPLDWADEVRGWLNVEWNADYDWGEGVLQLATAISGPKVTQLAGWIGSRHSLKVTMDYADRDTALKVLAPFTITDSEFGIVVSADQDEDILMPVPGYTPSVTERLTNLGYLDIKPLTKDVLSQLPVWRGAEVAGGELFIESGTEDSERVVLVVVGETCLIRFSSTNESDSLAELADLIGQIQATWQPPKLSSAVRGGV